jgi:hypothetical protein
MREPRNPEAAAWHRRQRRRRWRRLLLVLAVVGAVVAGYRYAAALAKRQLDEAIAAADRLDPGWRLEELEGPRPVLADDDNAFLVMRQAHAALPQSWESVEFVEKALRNRERDLPLDDSQTKFLREQLDKAAAALAKARRLSDLPRGAYRLSDSPEKFYVPQEARTVTRLLWYEAMLRANDNDAAGALQANRAALHASRTVGDVSNIIGYLVRIACRGVALEGIETTLALTQPADVDLAGLQSVLEAEERLPLLINALRGERAFYHQVFTSVETGEQQMSRHPLLAIYSDINLPADFEFPPVVDAYDSLGMPMLMFVHAWVFRELTALTEAAKVPASQQTATFNALSPPRPPIPLPALRGYGIVASKIYAANQRDLTRLRCTIVAIAAERYRLKHGAWPDSLADLAPTPLPESWIDPYDGQPLRYRVLEDGVIVYSVGPDGQDNGGKLDKNPNAPGTDIGVRLWNPESRRQGAEP